jgi:hypothetical protein
MKNPPDYFVITFMGMISTIGFLVAIFLFISVNEGRGSYVALRALGAVICGFISIWIIVKVLLNQFVYRPNEVDVEEEIRLYWRHKEPKSKSYSSLENLFVEPSAPNAWWTKKTGGSVRFKDDEKRCVLSYEIISAIEQKYLEKMGQKPPLPIWAQKKK